MSDISMCSGEGCLLKEKCFRFKAEPNPYSQSYFKEPPFNPTESDEQPSCDYFWGIKYKPYNKKP